MLKSVSITINAECDEETFATHGDATTARGPQAVAVQARSSVTYAPTSILHDERPEPRTRMRRRVLMISCAFPPTGGPGVQRSAKFAKYLPACGWQPVVWAAEHMPDLPRDQTLLADLPDDLRIGRLRVRDPRARFREWRQREAVRRQFAWRAERIWNRLLHCMWPDPMACWAVRSYRACRRLIDAEGIDAIYSTYSPASNHLLAWWLQRATGLPWIADFRDLWTDDYGYPYGRLRRRLDRALERAFIRSADAVVAVSAGQRDVLRCHDIGKPDKFHTITNGVDLADLAALDRRTVRGRLHGPDDRFVLTFTGWFLSDRVSGGLIEGLARAGAWVKTQGGVVVLRIVGQIADGLRRQFVEAGVCVETPGYLPHDEAIAHQAAADVLLLLVPDSPNGATLIPGKTFEYLASGRPILLVGPTEDGAAAQLLMRCATGTFARTNADSVFDALSALWRQWRMGQLPAGCQAGHLRPLTREHLAQRLGDVLASVCAQHTVATCSEVPNRR
jgi:glycosyltransferase involved in cell wall biosynthesis